MTQYLKAYRIEGKFTRYEGCTQRPPESDNCFEIVIAENSSKAKSLVIKKSKWAQHWLKNECWGFFDIIRELVCKRQYEFDSIIEKNNVPRLLTHKEINALFSNT